jgi:hypothetical protein
MTTSLIGIGLLVASCGALYPVTPLNGMSRKAWLLSAWGDILAALAVCGLITGLVLSVIGIAKLAG